MGAPRTHHVSPAIVPPLLPLTGATSPAALGLEKEIGNFEPGKWFDALVLDPDAPGSQIPLMENDTTDDIFSKLIYLSTKRI